MIGADALAAGLAIPLERATFWAPYINDAMEQFDINTHLRQAAFCAQVAHESESYTVFVERMSYSKPERICEMWPSRFRSVDEAQPFVRSPQALANFVYSKRNGNGDVASGDGWRYRGRGGIMVTGLDNYAACSNGVGIDFVAQPELLERPDLCMLASAWWWDAHGCNEAADTGDINKVTRIINGPKMAGARDRERLFRNLLDTIIV